MSDVLREEMTAIRDAHDGVLTPEIVLDVARAPEHPLHSRFEWNDSVAAEKYRRHQAHVLIQKSKIVYRDPEGGEPPRLVRAFIAIKAGEGHVYDPTEEVAEDPIRRQLALRDMERDWKALRRRYEMFAEFFEMIRRDLGEGEQDAA